MPEPTFMGVPRHAIDWAPTIDYAKCDFCMECDEFCPHGVFERRAGEVKLVVSRPENCVVFCRACAKTCGPDAICFPDKPQTVARIKELRAAAASDPIAAAPAGAGPGGDAAAPEAEVPR